jgi:hypothetical protein
MPVSGSYFYPQVQSPNSSYPTVDVRLLSLPPSASSNVGKLFMSASVPYFLDPDGNALQLMGSSATSVITGTVGVLGVIHFGSEYDNGNTGDASDTIDWNVSNKQKVTLTGSSTFAFTDPPGACNLTLRMVQDATGNHTGSWPATVKWASSTAPTLSTGSNAIDVVSFYFDGTNYHGQASTNFA